MVTKAEAERAVRQLVRQWLRDCSEAKAAEAPSFYDFKRWLQSQGYAHYLGFRSAMGPDYDAETWFDQETGQTWRR